MTKVELNNISPQNSVTTASSTINDNNNTVETAFDNTLSRDGTSPNQMESDFDMNSNQILNLPNPRTATSPLRLQDLSNFVGGGTVTNLPPGGATGDVMTKTTGANYDVGWSHVVLSVLPGTNINVTGSSPATVSTVANPNFATSVTTPSLILNGTTLNSKTGTGAVVLATSPTLVTPALGTPSSGVATNLTGTAAGLTAGTVTTNANLTGEATSVGNAATLTNSAVIGKVLTGYTSGAGTVAATDTILSAIQKLNGNDATNANLTGPITSVGNATSIASQTGTGSKFVVDTSPTLVTPNLGTPSAAVLTNATGTASGLTAGNVTTNANLTGDVTSVGNATTLTNAPVISKVLTGYVSGAGTVSSADSILSAIQKLNGNNATNANLTGDVTSVGNATTLAAGSASNLNSGTLLAARMPAHTGDVTSSAGSVALTLAAGNAGNLNSGTLLAARMPALTGDCTTSSGAVATTVTKINGVDQTTAWTTYTPTITAAAGTPTTVSATGRYKQIGKTVFLQLDITITAIGTASGALNATLPVTAAAFRYAGSVFEYASSAKSGAGFINGVAAPTIFATKDAAAGSWWVNGYGLAVTITYEVP